MTTLFDSVVFTNINLEVFADGYTNSAPFLSYQMRHPYTNPTLITETLTFTDLTLTNYKGGGSFMSISRVAVANEQAPTASQIFFN